MNPTFELSSSAKREEGVSVADVSQLDSKLARFELKSSASCQHNFAPQTNKRGSTFKLIYSSLSASFSAACLWVRLRLTHAKPIRIAAFFLALKFRALARQPVARQSYSSAERNWVARGRLTSNLATWRHFHLLLLSKADALMGSTDNNRSLRDKLWHFHS